MNMHLDQISSGVHAKLTYCDDKAPICNGSPEVCCAWTCWRVPNSLDPAGQPPSLLYSAHARPPACWPGAVSPTDLAGRHQNSESYSLCNTLLVVLADAMVDRARTWPGACSAQVALGQPSASRAISCSCPCRFPQGCAIAGTAAWACTCCGNVCPVHTHSRAALLL